MTFPEIIEAIDELNAFERAAIGAAYCVVCNCRVWTTVSTGTGPQPLTGTFPEPIAGQTHWAFGDGVLMPVEAAEAADGKE